MTRSTKQIFQNIAPHLIGWLAILVFPFLLFEQHNERSFEWIVRFYYQLLFMALAFYINYLVLVPVFLFREKKTKYYISAFLLSVLVVILSIVMRRFAYFHIDALSPAFDIPGSMPSGRAGGQPFLSRPLVFLNTFGSTLLVIGFSTGIRITQHWTQNKYKQKELEKAHVDSELAFLKNQVSPHFFFNTLNNIYALIKVDDNKAQYAVERLSNMMRYLIYESEDKLISLEKELQFMTHYIDLMTLRISPKVELKIDFPENIPDVKIPPLLYISFIENAFKHGISYRSPSFIHIRMVTDTDRITFICQNSIHTTNSDEEKTAGGLGLINIKKRLQLIYGDTANLNISSINNTFFVILNVPIEFEPQPKQKKE